MTGHFVGGNKRLPSCYTRIIFQRKWRVQYFCSPLVQANEHQQNNSVKHSGNSSELWSSPISIPLKNDASATPEKSTCRRLFPVINTY